MSRRIRMCNNESANSIDRCLIFKRPPFLKASARKVAAVECSNYPSPLVIYGRNEAVKTI